MSPLERRSQAEQTRGTAESGSVSEGFWGSDGLLTLEIVSAMRGCPPPPTADAQRIVWSPYQSMCIMVFDILSRGLNGRSFERLVAPAGALKELSFHFVNGEFDLLSLGLRHLVATETPLTDRWRRLLAEIWNAEVVEGPPRFDAADEIAGESGGNVLASPRLVESRLDEIPDVRRHTTLFERAHDYPVPTIGRPLYRIDAFEGPVRGLRLTVGVSFVASMFPSRALELQQRIASEVRDDHPELARQIDEGELSLDVVLTADEHDWWVGEEM